MKNVGAILSENTKSLCVLRQLLSCMILKDQGEVAVDKEATLKRAEETCYFLEAGAILSTQPQDRLSPDERTHLRAFLRVKKASGEAYGFVHTANASMKITIKKLQAGRIVCSEDLQIACSNCSSFIDLFTQS